LLNTWRTLEEELRMYTVPGIVFTDGPAGPRARLKGGLDVWEVVRAYKDHGDDWARVAVEYDWLRPDQIAAARRYYELFPAEIDARLAREGQLTPERVARDYPFLRRRTR
jgi:uncharacterized protein (DUF433 family)